MKCSTSLALLSSSTSFWYWPALRLPSCWSTTNFVRRITAGGGSLSLPLVRQPCTHSCTVCFGSSRWRHLACSWRTCCTLVTCRWFAWPCCLSRERWERWPRCGSFARSLQPSRLIKFLLPCLHAYSLVREGMDKPSTYRLHISTVRGWRAISKNLQFHSKDNILHTLHNVYPFIYLLLSQAITISSIVDSL